MSSEPEIDALLNEGRTFPPFAPSGARTRSPTIRTSTRAPPPIRRRSGPRSRPSSSGCSRGRSVLDWQPPHAKWFVGGTAQRQRELPRSARPHRAPQQGRDHLGRRARRSPHADLLRSAPRGLPVRERPEVARRQEGRSRRALPAADARARDRDARLRAHRRRPQRRLRRLQRRVAARSHQRRAGVACSSRPTAATAAASSCRSSRWPTRRCASTPSIQHVVVVQRERGRRVSGAHARKAAITGTTG